MEAHIRKYNNNKEKYTNIDTKDPQKIPLFPSTIFKSEEPAKFPKFISCSTNLYQVKLGNVFWNVADYYYFETVVSATGTNTAPLIKWLILSKEFLSDMNSRLLTAIYMHSITKTQNVNHKAFRPYACQRIMVFQKQSRKHKFMITPIIVNAGTETISTSIRHRNIKYQYTIDILKLFLSHFNKTHTTAAPPPLQKNSQHWIQINQGEEIRQQKHSVTVN